MKSLLFIGILVILTDFAAQAVPLFSTDVFISVDAGGKEYPPCYRQPVLVAVDNVTVLAFSTGRNKTGTSKSLCSDPGDGSPNYLCLKRSTDGGVTFQPLQILFGGSGENQPDFYVTYYDKEVKRVDVVFKTPKTLYRIHSMDNGVHWSTPVDFAPRFDKNTFQGIGPSVGKGALLSSQGGQRITLLPFICTSKGSEVLADKGACPTCHSCIVTDRSGEWQVEAVASSGSRESQLVVCDGKNVVYATERNMGKHPGHRKQAYSFDGGKTFAVQSLSTIPEPATKNWTGIKAGLARLLSGALVQSHPNSSSARKDLVLSVSMDYGASWDVGKVTVSSGLAGYSDLATVSDFRLGVLFENGKYGYADRITLAMIDVQELQAGGKAV